MVLKLKKKKKKKTCRNALVAFIVGDKTELALVAFIVGDKTELGISQKSDSNLCQTRVLYGYCTYLCPSVGNNHCKPQR